MQSVKNSVCYEGSLCNEKFTCIAQKVYNMHSEIVHCITAMKCSNAMKILCLY